MTLEQRAELMARLGVERVLAIAFDEGLARMEAADFCSEILHRILGAKVVIVGDAFRFGRGRRGDVAALRALGPRLGFDVSTVAPVMHDGTAVSSSRIREAVESGDVVLAAALLGRRFFLDGEVVAGDGRGRKLGIPTANLKPENQTLPALGVYACWCSGPFDPPRPAVVNVGRRPTFGGGGPVVEAHVLRWEGDLYGTKLRIEFASRLREERRFDDAGALLRQIRTDIEDAGRFLEMP
jgi:riboflavin kinase/FMN adenylyltransferase